MSGYSEQYDVLFIHVPKTAGSSMEQCEFVAGQGHEPYWAIREEIRNKAGFSFGFVRNPYDRFVSIVTEGMYATMRTNLATPRSGASLARKAIRSPIWTAGPSRFTSCRRCSTYRSPASPGSAST